MPDTTELPRPRGPLAEAVVTTLRDGAALPAGRNLRSTVDDADPFGADLAVALHTCYELHYHGFRGGAAGGEGGPGLRAFRWELGRVSPAGLRDAVAGGDGVAGSLDELLAEPV